ncbi:DUF6912 family protein [Nocardioides yefusunii]|uniref:DUF6912 family protein n=1 Tax=Nocardioides yefusunii TaxID=2500546 RepID=A0ABW1QSZ3_9ACTN|nr:hypothetical protein [Nocardioides yefusunii]
MSVRIYLPTTTDVLAQEVVAGEFVVAEGVEPVVAESDDEGDEYAALLTAADASTAMAVERGVAGLRRVVLVFETDAVPVAGAKLPVRQLVSAHVDVEDRDTDSDPDDDLAWFIPSELPHLL